MAGRTGGRLTLDIDQRACEHVWSAPAIVYDFVTRRSIHRATVEGIVFSVATFAVMIAVMVAIVFSPLIGIVDRFVG